jgi:putative membrane protein
MIMDMDGGMGWWMVFGMIWMVVFWGAVIWAIVWGMSRFGGHDHRSGESPLEIAKRRYARGEITKEQYEQLRHDLV